jgi:hypothetical protein
MSAHSSSDRRKPLDVDSTQRMRALTPTELYDSHRPKSYAVQLVLSDRPVNLDMMPRLEVFAAHRLYTIAAEQQNGTWHALRGQACARGLGACRSTSSGRTETDRCQQAGSRGFHEEDQDARGTAARRSTRSPAGAQRPEASSGTERLVAHPPVGRIETAPSLDLIVVTWRAAA